MGVGHDYELERIYGPRGPDNSWDTEDGKGDYIWLKTLEAHDKMVEYQKRFLPNCGVDHLL